MVSSSAPRRNRRSRRIIASSRIRASRAWTSGVELRAPRLGIGQVLVDFLVGEPPAALDRRRHRIGGQRNPVGRELDEHGLGVAHPVGLQAGQAVGDDLRQHRNHAVGQVDARAALVGLAVERRAGPHEVRHVGDVHAQPPVPLGRFLQRDRVVEVAGVDRIDRDGHQLRSSRFGPAESSRRTRRPGRALRRAHRRQTRRAG